MGPNDLDDLLASIRGESGGGSSSLSLYKGTRGTDLVSELIDERILNFLGLQDVFDIDYATYISLLREKAAAARMTGAAMESGEAEFALVAEDADGIAGHIILSRMQQPEGTLGLAPVSVRPDNQQQGIGKALILESLAMAKRDGWQAVFLLGDPAYYQRFGFSVENAARFDTPYPKKYFMVLDLSGEGVDHLSNIADYAPSFATI